MGSIGFSIDHVNFVHGEKRISTEETYKPKRKTLEKTGIPVVWESSKTAYELAEECLTQEETLHRIRNSNIKVIIYVTQTPAWYLPAHGYKIQETLNLNTNIQVIDLNQGCSGFVQGLSLATKILKNKETALLITADRYRDKLERNDLSTNLLFSDGAAVTLVTGDRKGHKVLSETHYTNGKGFNTLYHEVEAQGNKTTLHMNGWGVKQYVQQHLQPQITEVISKAKLQKKDIDTALLHQASKTVLEEIYANLGEYGIKTPTNLDKYGNTTSSTIPSLLYDNNGLSDTETTLLSGFGVGFSIVNMVVSPRA